MSDAVRIGEYLLGPSLGEGAMAQVYVALRVKSGGFRHLVAVKRLREALAREPDFVSMLVDEARLTARIDHPNVVGTQDVLNLQGELLIAMDYVRGLSLAEVASRPIPAKVACAIASDVLRGLHAAHELRHPSGESLELVHRDVSPGNIIVGLDGMARLIDFGIAKALGRLSSTRTGVIKGKFRYMAPELFDGRVDRRVDVYSLAICLWEMLTGERLFEGEEESALLDDILAKPIRRPSRVEKSVPSALDAIVLRGLERDPDLRFANAKEMADEIDATVGRASASEVSTWMHERFQDAIEARDALVEAFESSASALADIPEPDPIVTPQLAALGENRRAERTRASSRRSPWLAVGGAVVTATILAFFVTLPASKESSREASSEPSISSSSIVGAPIPLAASGVALPSLSAGPDDDGDFPAEEASARKLDRRRFKKRRIVDCSPPYWLDPKGVRHYKVECTR